MRSKVLALVLATSLLPTASALAGPQPRQAGIEVTPVAPPPRVPSLPGAVVSAALDAKGTVVRRAAGVEVARVVIPARIRSKLHIAASTAFRVTVLGRFPPRALRYVVTAGGTPVGYGIPTPSTTAVQAVTTSRAVLTQPVVAVYEADLEPTTPTPFGSAPAFSTSRAALAQGPFDVHRALYDFGDRAYQPPGLAGKVEMRADVFYPTPLKAGPFPLVLFMHGNHVTCFKGNRVDFRWPCRPGWKPIPNFKGYDYIGRRLASFGYIVVSVSANGVNVIGSRLRDTGMKQRGELLERHIDLWRRWNNVGGQPFQKKFVGAVDLSRIGTMGHSRGGEGVVWNVIVDRRRTHPYGIDAVLPLAPVDFTRVTVNDVTLAVMLPYCDGDVSDLQGMHFFDDARYRVPGDPTPKHTVTVMGANHNFFNTVWTPGGVPGGFDDGMRHCGRLLTPAEERKVGSAYVADFFRRYLGGDLSLDDEWTGATTPGGIGTAQTVTTYLAPDLPDRRMDVDRFTEARSITRDLQDGPVTPRELEVYGWCPETFSVPCEPGFGGTQDVHLPGLPQGVFGWNGPGGAVRFSLPGGRDVSGFDAFQFRAATNYGYDLGGRVRQDLVAVLIDGNGNQARVRASAVGGAIVLAPPPGFNGHFILNQIRFPLAAFGGVDLTDVRAIELRFSRTDAGVIDVADMAFSRGAT